MYRSIVSLLYVILGDPEKVHRLARIFIGFLGLWPIRVLCSAVTTVSDPMLVQNICGIQFRNPVGLAGGLAKDSFVLYGLESLGFGFIEVGTFTKIPQSGSQKPRLFRYAKEEALINRMGFNNDGIDALHRELSSMSGLSIPLGISIGKSKDTPLSDAAGEYALSLAKVYEDGDYFAVNVSSPNTQGLRKLQDKEFLTDIVVAMNAYRDKQKKRKPLLVKISPDLTFEAIDELMEVCVANRIDGIIATNTTIERRVVGGELSEPGGLSGKPLRERSTETIRYLYRKYPTIPIIGVGGIFNADDAYEKIQAGASIVQIYTGFVFGGPLLVRRINRGLLTLIKRDGFATIKDAIGSRAQ